jgi:ribosomal protein S7
MLNSLGMRLAGQKEHRAALTLLALALRESLQVGAPMYEAKIRNNMALVLGGAGKKRLARRQIDKAMQLTANKVGTNNRFYRVLRSNLDEIHPGSAA